jgi:hypothetical protein
MSDLFTEVVSDARSAAGSLTAAAERALADTRAYIASPRGRRMRENIARGLVAVAPIMVSLPVVRRTWVGRVLGVAGAATVLVKVAEAIRDWEPGPAAELSGAAE